MSEQVAITEQDQGLLNLLRTKGLSIKNLDEKTKQDLRDFLERLCNSKGMSLNDVAKLIGNKTSGYTSWLCRRLGVKVRPFEEARLKGIKEKRRKYERKPFDGTDEDKAYLLGLRHGDLSVSKPWNGVVRVSTSTTHPAMAKLFRTSFEPYGHVYQHPRYKKDTRTYEWNLIAIVDDSFDFLLQSRAAVWDWVSGRETRLISYLAGVLDAEGSLGIYGNGSGTALQVLYYNTDLDLLEFIKGSLIRMGYGVLGPYLDKEKGTFTSKYRIQRRKDYWKIALAIFEQSKNLISLLPIRHPEKLKRKEIAGSLFLGQPWDTVRPGLEALRAQIRDERDEFVKRAENEYKEKHPKSIP